MIGYFKTVEANKRNQSSTQNSIHNSNKVIDFGLDKVSYNTETIEDVKESLAEKIANGEYVEPYNWQNKTEYCTSPNDNGYLKVGSTEKTDPTQSKYFWIEELKNWCTYRVWAGCPLTIDGIQWTVRIVGSGGASSGVGSYYNYTFKYTFTTNEGEFGNASKYHESDKNKFIDDYKQGVYDYITNNTSKWKGSNFTAAMAMKNYSSSKCLYDVEETTSVAGYKSSVVWENNHFVPHNELSYLKDIGETALQLCVWNGVDAFVPLNYYQMDGAYKEVAIMQNYITATVMSINGNITKHRGVYNYNAAQDLTGYGNPQWNFSYDPNVTVYSKAQKATLKGESWYQSPVSILHAIILESNKNYSIYDKTSFQCRRLGKPMYAYYPADWEKLDRSSFEVAKDRAAVRQGMSTGNPGIFRTATGELALATMLVYGGVMQLFGDHGNGFDTAPVNFLNDICKEFFGDGLNKTCAQHWLKLGDNINTNDEIPSGDIATLYETSLDKTLNPQINKSTTDNLSMTLSTEDVAVEITEEKKPDYAVKW